MASAEGVAPVRVRRLCRRAGAGYTGHNETSSRQSPRRLASSAVRPRPLSGTRRRSASELWAGWVWSTTNLSPRPRREPRRQTSKARPDRGTSRSRAHRAAFSPVPGGRHRHAKAPNHRADPISSSAHKGRTVTVSNRATAASHIDPGSTMPHAMRPRRPRARYGCMATMPSPPPWPIRPADCAACF